MAKKKYKGKRAKKKSIDLDYFTVNIKYFTLNTLFI